ncbi:MAG: hypothetical protein WCV90_03545 [Candidatus Woesearchaeota archaeon]|jgi:hypothetical protein
MANISLETITLEKPLTITVGVYVMGHVPDGFYKRVLMDGSRCNGHVLEIPTGTEIWSGEKELEKLRFPIKEPDLNTYSPRLWVRHDGTVYRVEAKQYGEGMDQRGFQSIRSTWRIMGGLELADLRRFKRPFPKEWFPSDNGGSIYDWQNWTWPDGTKVDYKH